MVYANGDKYEGGWQNNKREGNNRWLQDSCSYRGKGTQLQGALMVVRRNCGAA
jgi:hypothetical protein